MDSLHKRSYRKLRKNNNGITRRHNKLKTLNKTLHVGGSNCTGVTKLLYPPCWFKRPHRAHTAAAVELTMLTKKQQQSSFNENSKEQPMSRNKKRGRSAINTMSKKQPFDEKKQQQTAHIDFTDDEFNYFQNPSRYNDEYDDEDNNEEKPSPNDIFERGDHSVWQRKSGVELPKTKTKRDDRLQKENSELKRKITLLEEQRGNYFEQLSLCRAECYYLLEQKTKLQVQLNDLLSHSYGFKPVK